MTEIWGFDYIRRRELYLWCFIVNHCPYIPRYFDEALKRYVAQYICYEIRLNMQNKFSYVKTWFKEGVQKERHVVGLWMKNKTTTAVKLGRRMGKTTILFELIKCIPDTLSVLVILPSLRLARDIAFNNNNVTLITKEELKPDFNWTRFDFIFGEHVRWTVNNDNTRILFMS